jgi:hypothetical protein
VVCQTFYLTPEGRPPDPRGAPSASRFRRFAAGLRARASRQAVAHLANALGAWDGRLEAGWVVLSGGLAEAQPLVAGRQVDATFARLGRVGLRATV